MLIGSIVGFQWLDANIYSSGKINSNTKIKFRLRKIRCLKSLPSSVMKRKRKLLTFSTRAMLLTKEGILLLTVFCIDVQHMNDVTPKRREIIEENREMI
jgi:hypothetical protein